MATLPGGLWHLPLWLYLHLPGFAEITEWIYRFIAAHRNAGYRITRALWGKRVEPSHLQRRVLFFARAIALDLPHRLHLFRSPGQRPDRRAGNPTGHRIPRRGHPPVRRAGVLAGPDHFLVDPQRVWARIHRWGGAVVAGVAAIGRPHTPGQKAAFVLLFVYYLSIVNGGQIFMGYQWDFLLLEAGFLAIFLKPVIRARLAVPLAAVPADVRIRRGQAAQSRSHLAQPDRPRRAL